MAYAPKRPDKPICFDLCSKKEHIGASAVLERMVDSSYGSTSRTLTVSSRRPRIYFENKGPVIIRENRSESMSQ